MSQWGHGPGYGPQGWQQPYGYGPPPGYPPPMQQGPRCPICGYVGRMRQAKRTEQRNGCAAVVFALIFWPIALLALFFGRKKTRATQCPKCRTVLGGFA